MNYDTLWLWTTVLTRACDIDQDYDTLWLCTTILTRTCDADQGLWYSLIVDYYTHSSVWCWPRLWYSLTVDYYTHSYVWCWWSDSQWHPQTMILFDCGLLYSLVRVMLTEWLTVTSTVFPFSLLEPPAAPRAVPVTAHNSCKTNPNLLTLYSTCC